MIKSKNRGFSIIELLVVMAVLAILVLLATPWFGDEVTEAKAGRIKSDIKIVNDFVEGHAIKNQTYPVYKDITTDINDYFNQGKIYSLNGKVVDASELSGNTSFKVVSGDFVRENTSSSLEGVFVMSDSGDLYYIHEPMSAPGPFDTAPVITASITEQTNTDVDVSISYPAESVVNEYKVGNGSWENYNTPIVVTTNTTIYARGFNSDNVESKTATYIIDNIDKEPPVITLAPYTMTPTNQNISVTASVNKGTLNETSHTFTENGSFTFVATDQFGNTSSKIVTINNIDKTLPIISVTLSPSTPTNGTVVATATTDKGTLNEDSYTFITNGSFEFVASDSAGNTASEVVTVDFIDNTAPVVTFTPNGNSTEAESQSTVVTVTDENGIGTLQYQWTNSSVFPTGGTWNVFTSGNTLTKNAESGNFYLHVKGFDMAGNEANVTSNVFVLKSVNKFVINFGGSGWDVINSVNETNDGGFIVAGYSSSLDGDLTGFNFEDYDGIIIKYDSLGNAEWIVNYGGTDMDWYYSVIPTEDGGYIAVGYATYLNGDAMGADDALIVKYDSFGNVQWADIFGGSIADEFSSVVQLSDGSYIAAGSTSSVNYDIAGLNKGGADGIIAKYDTLGNKVWNKNFGGSSSDLLYSLTKTTDGGFVVAGTSASLNGDMAGLNKGDSDAVAAKYDSSGNLQWVTSFGGTGFDRFKSIEKTIDGGFIAAGNSYSTDVDMTGLGKGSSDAIIVKLDSLGNTQWVSNFGGSNLDYFDSAVQVVDGSYIAVGNSVSINGDMTGLNKGSNDAIIVKFDASGNKQWTKVFGGSGAENFVSVINTVDGGYIATGDSRSTNGDLTGLSKGGKDGIIVKFDSLGNWE